MFIKKIFIIGYDTNEHVRIKTGLLILEQKCSIYVLEHLTFYLLVAKNQNGIIDSFMQQKYLFC